MKLKWKLLLAIALVLNLTAILSNFFYWQATLAIRLRPELAHFTFTEALFSEHFYSWLWYNYPSIGLAVYAVLFSIVAISIILKLEG